MINKLLEAVIKKHGPINIQSINTGSGKFRITGIDYKVCYSNLKGNIKNCDLFVDCFELEQGLINFLSKDHLK